MAASEQRTAAAQLPLNIAQPIDLGRLIRELDKLDEQLRQEAIRGEAAPVADIILSPNLKELLTLHKIDIHNITDRGRLKTYLEAIKTQAPVVHISFSTEATPDFIQKIVAWFRKEVHPMILVTVGLEPTIGAGSTLRTTNHFFDFSLASRLKKEQKLMAEKLNEVYAPVEAKNP